MVMVRMTADPPAQPPGASATGVDKVERDALEGLQDQLFELASEVQDAAAFVFDGGVETRVTLTRGSIELGVVVVALGAVAQFRNAAENLQWLAEFVRGIVSRFLPPGIPMRTAATTRPSQMVSATPDPVANVATGSVATPNVAPALPRFVAPSLVGLLAIMNVALLATVIVLALR